MDMIKRSIITVVNNILLSLLMYLYICILFISRDSSSWCVVGVYYNDFLNLNGNHPNTNTVL